MCSADTAPLSQLLHNREGQEHGGLVLVDSKHVGPHPHCQPLNRQVATLQGGLDTVSKSCASIMNRNIFHFIVIYWHSDSECSCLYEPRP